MAAIKFLIQRSNTAKKFLDTDSATCPKQKNAGIKIHQHERTQTLKSKIKIEKLTTNRTDRQTMQNDNNHRSEGRWTSRARLNVRLI